MALVLTVTFGALAQAADATPRRAEQVRFATFNVSLHRATEGALLAELRTGDSAQAKVIAETIQTTRPDVLLVNEFDHVAGGAAVQVFRSLYLEVSQNGRPPIEYPYVFIAPVNTGIPSGHHLHRDGHVGGPDDALGFREFPGQYGMAVLSRYPIEVATARTFQHFRWQDMPGASLPGDPVTGGNGDWYSPQGLADLPLSSTSHWDVPRHHRTRSRAVTTGWCGRICSSADRTPLAGVERTAHRGRHHLVEWLCSRPVSGATGSADVPELLRIR